VDGLVQIFDLDKKQDVTPGYLKDHPNAVLRFLPDGRHLLYAPALKRVDVRDPASGAVAAGFDVPGSVTSYRVDLASSADGKRVFLRHSDSNGMSVALFADLSESPPTTQSFRGNSSNDQWAMSADGKRLFHGWDRGVAAYDTASGERIGYAVVRYRSYYPLVPTPDGTKLIAGWDRNAMMFELTADGFGEPGSSPMESQDFAFAPDGKTIVRAGVGVYDAKGSLTAVEAAHDRTNLRVTVYSRTAGRCVDLFNDRPPVVWDPFSGKVVHRFDLYAAAVGLGVTPDGRVSVRHADRTVRVYAADGQPQGERTARANKPGTVTLGLTPDGTASVEYDAKDRKLFTYDTASGTGTAWPQEFTAPPHTVRFDPTGRRAYVAGGNYAGVFEVGTGRKVRTTELSGAAGFSDDGRAVAVVGRKELRVYELASGKERLTAELPATDFDTQEEARFSRRWSVEEEDSSTPRGAVQFSADGGRVVVFWANGRVTGYDTADGAVRFREPRTWSNSRTAALRPDGDWFATTARTSRRIALRNVADPRADRNAVFLAECKSNVVGLAFTPDGKRLVSAHEDGTALVWDVEAALKTAPPPDPEPAESLWLLLASGDAKQAGKGVAGLIARPDAAVQLLAEEARPVTAPPADRIKAAIAALGDRDFKVREAAERQLRAWGELASDELTAAEPTANAEQGERIRRLLEALDGEETDLTRLQLLRAVEVLERVGGPSAKAVLERLAGGAAVSGVTREAKEALKRLKERGR
jgi:WD40 repeat protein